MIDAGTTHHLHLILCLVEIEGGVEVEEGVSPMDLVPSRGRRRVELHR